MKTIISFCQLIVRAVNKRALRTPCLTHCLSPRSPRLL